MKKLIIYIHGKGGSAVEAGHYRPIFADCDVTGLDYKAETPWEAEAEFPRLLAHCGRDYDSVSIIANSIGAYFALNALSCAAIDRAWFISPVADMEQLICGMMRSANVSEDELREKGEIVTGFGETLSWRYLCYAREHPISWNIRSDILYAEHDALTSFETVSRFAEAINASLTVMKNGEHWFHTDEQMDFLDSWLKSTLN